MGAAKTSSSLLALLPVGCPPVANEHDMELRTGRRTSPRDYPKILAVHARIVAPASASGTRGPQNIGSMAACATRIVSHRGPSAGVNAASAELSSAATC